MVCRAERQKLMRIKSKSKELTMCAMFAALIAAGAFIRIDIPLPLYTMHFTLQWFFVLMAGFLLGAKDGMLSVIVYLAIGLVGFPVFAAGGGPAYVLRPGFGFLLGFVAAAWLIGYMTEHSSVSTGKKGGSWLQMLIPATVGLVVYYSVGAVYFYLIKNLYVGEAVPFQLIVVQYCLITVPPDFLLCVLASILSARLKEPFRQMLTG